MKKLGIVFGTVLAVIIGGILIVRTLVFPLKYETEIKKYAQEYKVEPELIAAIIQISSNFDSKEYKKGEKCGPMNLQDKSAEVIAKEMGFTDFKPENLADPDTNIKIGTWFIAQNYKNKDVEQAVTKWGGVNWQDVKGDKEKDEKKKFWEDYYKKYFVEKIKNRMKVYEVLYPSL
ncbi:transglycosylase SLT domain-containing protein [Clostridium ganghwense]|uniref:Transglycosylase SLT domain-containing protein n=1 Tax=Clostridium ganghwense TaxID=312089 RepID=A0ABT4CRP4_9CLOT|nr:transglycosylase SLT domain-containing protein [Clostridium ganghwense]MCY6371712.1 transglycosylase SLT domain-containing protein [Clostridium ganghwense]